MAEQTQLLHRAAELAVGEFQEGRTASVEDILHLEKRWHKLPGSSGGKVALEDVKALLGQEVLAGEALDFVVESVFPGQDLSTLSKRQFLSIAHVAEVAQSKAFDLVTAEDAFLVKPPTTTAHKKRPPAIRDTQIDTWQIAAANRHSAAAAAAAAGHEDEDAADDGRLAAALPQVCSSPNRRTSSPGRSPNRPGRSPGSRAGRRGPVQDGKGMRASQSACTEYHSAAEGQGTESEGEVEQEAAAVAAQPWHGAGSPAPASNHNGLVGEDSAVLVASSSASPARASPSKAAIAASPARASPNKAVSSASPTKAAPSVQVPAAPMAPTWETFSPVPQSGLKVPVGDDDATPLTAQQQHMNEKLVAAAMVAGMTFMQQLQAGESSAQPSPFADMNPLKQAAALAAAAAVAATSPTMRGQATHQGFAASGVEPAAAAAAPPQQLIAEMMARMNVEGGASAQELQQAAATLQQRALAMQQQAARQHPAASHPGSANSGQSGEGQQQQFKAMGVARGRENNENWGMPGQQQQQKQLYQQQQPQPQESSHQSTSQAGSSHSEVAPPPTTVRLAFTERLRAPAEGVIGWTAMSKEDVERCRTIFNKKGYNEVGGMEKHSAMEYFAKLHMEPAIFHQAWDAADLQKDGRLDCREFCLFVQLLRMAQKGRPLPVHLSEEMASALVGEVPMPAVTGHEVLHIDTVRLRSVLNHSRQAAMAACAQQVSVLQDWDDTESQCSQDSGIAESVAGSQYSGRSHRTATQPSGNGHYSLGRPPVHPANRTGLGSVLGAGSGVSGALLPRVSDHGGSVLDQTSSHRLLEVAVRSAEIRYKKQLNMPIFTVSIRDSLGRLVELPIDTHPGHYRRETNMIHSSAIVRTTTHLRNMPPGSLLFLEIKHWKSDKKRFSTLAWSYAPLEKLVDFGPASAQVRGGPLDLPLFKKPMDTTLRKTKRLTSRAYDLHLTIRGIE